ncbi:hypothetical protein MKZ25_19730 [Solibacillus sp. FSL W7-1464]|uniref:hypothetical protein n=1 Tax=Solibacillus sp. FSL W7-1464 TaxID=2921706 RepID=UPI0030F54376
MKWMRVLPIILLTFLLVACGDSQLNLEGEWDANGSDGVAGSFDFKDNDLLTMDFGAMKFSYEWEVEGNQLHIVDKKDGEVKRDYFYEIEQQDKDNVTLYELDEDGKRVEGATIKLSK